MPLTKAPKVLRTETAVPSGRLIAPATRSPVALACEFILLALVGWRVITAALAIRAHARLPFQFDYGEGNVLATAVRIVQGLTPYPDPRAFPNAIDPYGPVGYYLLAVPVKLFGVSLLAPRLLLIASVVATCAFLALIIVRATRSTATAVIFAAAYICLPLVQGLAAVLRVDFIGLALTAAGLYTFCRALPLASASADFDKIGDGQSTIDNRFAFIAAVLFVAAGFCKHSLLAAPAACTLCLVARHRWREAANFVGAGAALGVVAFAVAEWLTHGFFAEHLFLTHPDPSSWNGYALRITRLAIGAAPLVVLALVRIFWELRRRQLSVPSWWFLLATISAITAGKQGSGWNHFLEWEAALCLCAALGWDVVKRTRPAAVMAGAWLAVLLIWPAQSMFDWSNGLQQCPQAYAYIRDHAGDRVLSENVSALLLGGKTVWVIDPFVYSQIVMHGTWRDDVIEPRLRSRWFDLVVMRRDYTQSPGALLHGVERFSGGMLQGLAANYRAVRTFQCTDVNVVFEPLPLQSNQATDR
jgi:hypothetical protein